MNGLEVAFKRLWADNLREDVSRILVCRYVFHRYGASTPKLTHLEHLTVDMARVLGGGVTMAQIVSTLVVSVDSDWRGDLQPHETAHINH